jgi:hypothetical protein
LQESSSKYQFSSVDTEIDSFSDINVRSIPLIAKYSLSIISDGTNLLISSISSAPVSISVTKKSPVE